MQVEQGKPLPAKTHTGKITFHAPSSLSGSTICLFLPRGVALAVISEPSFSFVYSTLAPPDSGLQALALYFIPPVQEGNI